MSLPQPDEQNRFDPWTHINESTARRTTALADRYRYRGVAASHQAQAGATPPTAPQASPAPQTSGAAPAEESMAVSLFGGIAATSAHEMFQSAAGSPTKTDMNTSVPSYANFKRISADLELPPVQGNHHPLVVITRHKHPPTEWQRLVFEQGLTPAEAYRKLHPKDHDQGDDWSDDGSGAGGHSVTASIKNKTPHPGSPQMAMHAHPAGPNNMTG